MMNKTGAKKENRFVKYFRGLKSELKKIVWPTWHQVMKNTLVVIAVVVVFGVLISALDMLFNISIIQWFTK